MKVAICAIAKKENRYIREWVEWHKNLGISKIFLYDNNNPDGERFDEVIDDYIKSGFVEIIDVRGEDVSQILSARDGKAYRGSLQHKCYVDCYYNRVSDFDWVFFSDIDEFLKFKYGYTLETFLNQAVFEDTDTICVPWVCYDDNDLLHYDDRPVVERFTHLSDYQWRLVKSFVRTNKMMYDESMRHIIHTFRLEGDRIKFADGSKLLYLDNVLNFYSANPSTVNNSKCVVNHYKTKTIEEYLEKRHNRNWAQDDIFAKPILETLDKTLEDFFKYCKKTDEKMKIIDEFKIKNNIE